MAGERRTFSASEKVTILRRHLLDKVPVSNLCDEHGLNPTVFYRWQKDLFENGSAARTVTINTQPTGMNGTVGFTVTQSATGTVYHRAWLIQDGVWKLAQNWTALSGTSGSVSGTYNYFTSTPVGTCQYYLETSTVVGPVQAVVYSTTFTGGQP